MKTILGLFVLLLILCYLSATDSQGIVCPSDRIRATDGEDVTLPCYLHDERGVTINQVVWWEFNDVDNVVVYRRRMVAPSDQAKQFKDRATTDINDLDRGILTVKISSVKTTDGGTYTCSFKDEDQPPVSCNVHLTVDIRPIICPSANVTAVIGKNAALPCHLPDEHDVTGEVVWWKFNGSDKILVYRSRDSHPTEHADQFKDRAILDEKERYGGNLTVNISPVETTDEGNYTCSLIKNDQPPISCNVHLTVENTEDEPDPVGWIISVIVVAVLVAVLAVGIWKWRKRYRLDCPAEWVTGGVGEDVTLPCRLHDGRDVTGKMVTWKFNDSDKVIVYGNGQIDSDDQADQFLDRANMDVTGLRRGSLTIKISLLRTTDDGTYTCSLKDGPLQFSRNVHLTVDRYRFGHSDELVTATVGENVNLSWHLHGGCDMTGTSISWKFNDIYDVFAYGYRYTYFDQADQFYGRTAIEATELCRGILVLTISSVRRSDGGTYTCYIQDGLKKTSRNIYLAVADPAVCKDIELQRQQDLVLLQEQPQEPLLNQASAPNDANDGPTTSSDAADSQAAAAAAAEPLNVSQSALLPPSEEENPAELRDDEETETLDQQEKRNLLSETLIPTLRKTSEHPLSQDLTPREIGDQRLTEPDEDQ